MASRITDPVRPAVVLAGTGPAAPAVAVVATPSGLSLDPLGSAAGAIGYLGGSAMLVVGALGACARPRGSAQGIVPATVAQVDRLVVMGVPVVALVHVGMGSFLAMQAYFGATFIDGIGPLVGVGLIRNLAPMLAGFILAGLVAALNVAELRGRDRTPLEADDPARLAAARMLAAMVAGPILGAWGSLVGTLVGFVTANSMIGLSAPGFFDVFLEMLWVRDIIGLVVKGAGFGLVAAIWSCHEGLAQAGPEGHPPGSVGHAACRAWTLSGLALLMMNAGWFLLVYHAGAPFGPTVLTPPGR